MRVDVSDFVQRDHIPSSTVSHHFSTGQLLIVTVNAANSVLHNDRSWLSSEPCTYIADPMLIRRWRNIKTTLDHRLSLSALTKTSARISRSRTEPRNGKRQYLPDLQGISYRCLSLPGSVGITRARGVVGSSRWHTSHLWNVIICIYNCCFSWCGLCRCEVQVTQI